VIEVSSKISLRRLMDGGADIFAIANRNHHNIRDGVIAKSPFIRKSLRVLRRV
jgi:hypothetical protein